MNKTSSLVIAFLLFIMVQFISAQGDLAGRLDKYMQAAAEVKNFSGAVMVVKNDTILLQKGYGLANREWNVPNTAETKFQIASNTKQFTAACILQLVEQGKLSLDDTLGRFIPGFEYGDTVTIHMMLTHSSGITDYFRFEEFIYNPVTIAKDSLVALLQSRLFDFLPGADLNYSNSNYFLLALIVEKVSGETFEDYLSNHILEVAGMQNTGIVHYDTLLAQRASGYHITDQGIENAFNEAYRPDLMFGCGSMYSTVADMYVWEKAMSGNKILSPSSLQKMVHPYGYSIAKAKTDADPANTTGGTMDPFWYHLGYGVFADTFMTHRRIFTRGGTSGFHSTIYRFVDDNCFIAVLQNNELNPDRVAEPLSAILFGSDFITPYKHEYYSIDPAILDKYTGKWAGNIYDDYWVIEVFTRDQKLYRRTEGYPDLELIPESETRFFYSDGKDKVIEFLPDKNGEINKAWFTMDGIRFLRTKIE